MEAKSRGRVLRLTATTEFDSVQAILADRMAGAPVSGTMALDFCVRSALAHLNAKTEEQRQLAKSRGITSSWSTWPKLEAIFYAD